MGGGCPGRKKSMKNSWPKMKWGSDRAPGDCRASLCGQGESEEKGEWVERKERHPSFLTNGTCREEILVAAQNLRGWDWHEMDIARIRGEKTVREKEAFGERSPSGLTPRKKLRATWKIMSRSGQSGRGGSRCPGPTVGVNSVKGGNWGKE